MSIYSKFIQGGYGRIRSLQNLKDQFFYKSLTGTKPNDCLVVADDLTSDISLICAPDYSVNFIDSYYCKDDMKYFDPYDEEDIYEGICRLVDDPIEAEIPESSWEDSSRRMKKIYRDAATEM